MSDHEFAHSDHGARHWDRTCPACVTESLRAELAAAQRLLRSIADMAPIARCENFHHVLADQRHGNDCPVVARWDAALEAAKEGK